MLSIDYPTRKEEKDLIDCKTNLVADIFFACSIFFIIHHFYNVF